MNDDPSGQLERLAKLESTTQSLWHRTDELDRAIKECLADIKELERRLSLLEARDRT